MSERVVVAMSGGVDSSVAAALLVDQGFEVVGLMLRLWSEPGAVANGRLNRCCTPDQMADARRVADALGIPFYVVDVQDFFYQRVVQYFIEEHAAGRTPNPCIPCNREVRFTYLLDRALALDATYLATGHYARVRHTSQGYRLLKALDEDKDQSYVLHVLNQASLAHVKFPVGDFTKGQVRRMAADYGLPVAGNSESMDLCFLADGDYRRFLAERAPRPAVAGPIITTDGLELGQHQGLPNYTIGQRKGLGVAAGEPLYVLSKHHGRNALIVGPRPELGRSELIAREVNWIAGAPPCAPTRVQVKIRYRSRPADAVVYPVAGGRVRVQFDQPVYGVAAGQGAVFYDGEFCIGGGIIAGQDSHE